jgi:hypothetical protein
MSQEKSLSLLVLYHDHVRYVSSRVGNVFFLYFDIPHNVIKLLLKEVRRQQPKKIKGCNKFV